jgi:ABC-2 type transport system ATP-binding protein
MTSPETDLGAAEHFAVSLRGLNKTYGRAPLLTSKDAQLQRNGRTPQNGTARGPALKDINLAIPRGEIFGLLGPNGAGKSTLINILAGLVVKTSGQVTLWGFDIDRNPRQARASIGVVPQELHFDPFFTPAESLELQAGLYGVPKAERRTMELLGALGLADKAHAYARTLSGGMRRRLLVAKAMVHNPPILVLDEPTAGVDVELRRQLWDYVRELNARGTTILLTTHYLTEAEELCDRIGIINHGALIACAATSELLAKIDRKALIITPEPLHAELPALAGLDVEKRSDGRLAIHYRRHEFTAGEILGRLQAAGLGVRDLSSEEADLEDVFLLLTRDGREAMS